MNSLMEKFFLAVIEAGVKNAPSESELFGGYVKALDSIDNMDELIVVEQFIRSQPENSRAREMLGLIPFFKKGLEAYREEFIPPDFISGYPYFAAKLVLSPRSRRVFLRFVDFCAKPNAERVSMELVAAVVDGILEEREKRRGERSIRIERKPVASRTHDCALCRSRIAINVVYSVLAGYTQLQACFFRDLFLGVRSSGYEGCEKEVYFFEF